METKSYVLNFIERDELKNIIKITRALNLVPSRLRYREKSINTKGRSIPSLDHGTVPIVLGIDTIPPKDTDQYQASIKELSR
jgi:hypothetical protein